MCSLVPRVQAEHRDHIEILLSKRFSCLKPSVVRLHVLFFSGEDEVFFWFRRGLNRQQHTLIPSFQLTAEGTVLATSPFMIPLVVYKVIKHFCDQLQHMEYAVQHMQLQRSCHMLYLFIEE